MLNNRKINTELLEKTITKVKQLFAESTPVPILRRKSLSDINSIMLPYTNYDARTISVASSKDAKVVAVAGPRFSDLPLFFHEVVFNQMYPVANIIAIGTELGYSDKDDQDFHDYCLRARKNQRYQTEGEFYEVDRSYISNQLEGSFKMEESICVTKGIQRSVLTVEHGYLQSTRLNRAVGKQKDEEIEDSKKVNVTVIAYDPAVNYLVFTKKQAPIIWKLFEEAQLQNTAFHDSVKGKGLAGQLILMFELMRSFDQIFKEDTSVSFKLGIGAFFQVENKEDVCADKIMQILNFIHSDKPGLIATVDQLEYAIRGAAFIMQNRYELKAVMVAGPVKPKRAASAPNMFRGCTKTNLGVQMGEAEILTSTCGQLTRKA